MNLSFSPSGPPAPARGLCARPACALDDCIDTVCRRAARLLGDGVPRLGEIGPERLAPVARGGRGSATRRSPAGPARRASPWVWPRLARAAMCWSPTRRGSRAAGSCASAGRSGPITMESANVALTWVRSNAARLAGVAAHFDEGAGVHVHLADASRGKNGPSAGVTLAVVSARSGQPVRGKCGDDRRADAGGTGRAGRGHPGEGAGGVPGPG